ncbi:MAG: hypothetical protein ABI844_18915 [Saprospiraceae bacterium]
MRTIHYAIPIVLFIIICTVLMFLVDRDWAIGLGIGIIALVGLYFLKNAIDWNYYLKHPPSLEIPVLKLLLDIPFYRQLNEPDKSKFESRLAMFMIAHEYKMQPKRNSEDDEPMDAPEDLKAICSVPAIMLTLDKEEYLMREIEQIVLYNHPFPSPNYHQLHNSESNKEDKVLIFSLPNLEKGVKEPFTYFDIGMYEWSRISGNIDFTCQNWINFKAIYGIDEEALKLAIGLPLVDLPAVCKVMRVHYSYIHTLHMDHKAKLS